MIVCIDSHKEMLTACIVDYLGRVLGAQPFSNSPGATRIRWLGSRSR